MFEKKNKVVLKTKSKNLTYKIDALSDNIKY